MKYLAIISFLLMLCGCANVKDLEIIKFPEFKNLSQAEIDKQIEMDKEECYQKSKFSTLEVIIYSIFIPPPLSWEEEEMYRACMRKKGYVFKQVEDLSIAESLEKKK
jgi:hypothetical protein